MVVAAPARTAPIPLTATTATTMPRADWLAADWLALVDRWRPQIVNYAEGEFTVDGRTERRCTTRLGFFGQRSFGMSLAAGQSRLTGRTLSLML
jgi:hypothetical protein